MEEHKHILKLFVLAASVFALADNSALAQTVIVGDGGEYESIFSTTGNATVDPPNGGLANLTLGGTAGPVEAGNWDLTANGGASISVLSLGLIETGAETLLTGDSLQFNLTDNHDSLVGALLGVNATIATSWDATFTFDAPGSEVTLAANTKYTFSFDYSGQNGLFSNTLAITPTASFQFLDGNGVALTEGSNGSLINLIGLFGGTDSGTATFSYTTGDSVSAGPVSVNFSGSALLNSTALGLGTEYAEFSGMRMTAAPVPEPAGAMLFLVGATVLLVFRRPVRPSRA